MSSRTTCSRYATPPWGLVTYEEPVDAGYKPLGFPFALEAAHAGEQDRKRARARERGREGEQEKDRASEREREGSCLQ